MIFLSDPNVKIFQIFSLILYLGIVLIWIPFLWLDPSLETLFGFIFGCGGFGLVIIFNLKRKQIAVFEDRIDIEGVFEQVSVPLEGVEKIISTLIAPPFYKIKLKDGRLYYFSVNKELSIKLSLKLGNDFIVTELNRLVVNSKSSS